MQEKDIYEFAKTLLAQNPDKANTPLGKKLLQILESGDYAEGKKVANNLCESYGMSRQDFTQKAEKFFGF